MCSRAARRPPEPVRLQEHGLYKLLGARLAIIVAAASTILACSAGRLALPTQPPSDGGGAALLGPAVLVVDEAGTLVCLSADVEGQRTALIWPNGYYALPTTPMTVADAHGATVARVADTIWLGGGFAPGPWPQLEDCPDHDGHVFWVADVTHTPP